MSQTQKWLLSVSAAAIAILAFVLLRPDSSDNTTQRAQPTTTAPATATAPRSAAPAAEPPPPAPPPYVQIRARGLKPVGGVKTIKVNKGDIVRFEIRSDQVEEGHLHGYDISKPVGPGRRARFKFKAKFEGIFELELEHAGVPIGELQVNP